MKRTPTLHGMVFIVNLLLFGLLEYTNILIFLWWDSAPTIILVFTLLKTYIKNPSTQTEDEW